MIPLRKPPKIVTNRRSRSRSSTDEETAYADSELTDSDSSLTAPVSKKMKRRVHWDETVEVFETYHKEDYPARSMRAPDEPEDVERMLQAKATAEEQSTALGIIIAQRGSAAVLPDLRRNWAVPGMTH